ncbi:Imm63 family immunity protein [Luteibacter aegosomatissinici]|uniref:Imm63 family immunity protein n=1 Tax=Luteibacter aegosomatissinici TaxID=2911539 RepID=UPI001FFA0AB9|nr:Imm63 family immunity protein [Luteibacter aegosomatissinici]UPG94221.1 immunity 63 family protein [Luteibacter aegosomatissinici]
MTTEIDEVRDEVARIGKLIGAPSVLLEVRTAESSDGTPYLEITDEGYSYIAVERGLEISRQYTPELDGILYIIFKRITSQMALSYELRHRIDGQDFRRIYFSRRIELMHAAHQGWGDRQRIEIEEILKTSPFVD